MFFAAFFSQALAQKASRDAQVAYLKRQSVEANELLRKLRAEMDAASVNVIDVDMREVAEAPRLEVSQWK